MPGVRRLWPTGAHLRDGVAHVLAAGPLGRNESGDLGVVSGNDELLALADPLHEFGELALRLGEGD
jgi:hypothetical protein